MTVDEAVVDDTTRRFAAAQARMSQWNSLVTSLESGLPTEGSPSPEPGAVGNDDRNWMIDEGRIAYSQEQKYQDNDSDDDDDEIQVVTFDGDDDN